MYMGLKFYFDEMMPRAVAQQLIARGNEVIMAIDVGMTAKPDTEHLAYATKHEAILFTRDAPFAGLASQRSDHAGLICWTGADDDFGGMVRKLSEFAGVHLQDDVQGVVFWIK
jgi:predicted nuclease of predicted toxin-antitoxin system